MQISAFDLARRAPDWGAGEEREVKELCVCCLHCLTMALRSRLGVALADLEQTRGQLFARQCPMEGGDNSREKLMLADLENARKEIIVLHETISELENEKV